MNSKILALTFFLLSANAGAANQMILLGGSGDPAGPKTIFDNTVTGVGELVNDSSKWKYQVSFNGGHSETESLISSNFKKSSVPNTNFTKDNYTKIIASTIAKVNSGEITSADQLMLVIDTHGATHSPNDKTHKIAVNGEKPTAGVANGDYENLSGSDLVSVDALEDLVKATNAKGIKLAIIDMSCHSGNSLALKVNAPNTCIVTSTGTVHYAFAGPTTFSGKFWSNAKPGVSVEDAFLQTRLVASDTGYPMISTPQSAAIIEEVYKDFTPYLYFTTNDESPKMEAYLDENFNGQLLCQREAQFADLVKKIDLLQAATNGKKGLAGSDLKKLIADYKAQQDQMIKALAAMGGGLADTVETFETPIDYVSPPVPAPAPAKKGSKKKVEAPPVVPEEEKSIKKSYTWKEMFAMDIDGVIANYQGYYERDILPKTKAQDKALVENFKKLKAKREEILKKYPKMNKISEETKKLIKQMDNNYATVSQISRLEKQFYNELYKQKKAQSPNQNDVCNQIVF